MSGFAVEARAQPARPTFWKLFWAVLLGYIAAYATLLLLALGLAELGLLPRPFTGLIPSVTGAWSLDADLVAAVAIVLVAAWWIRLMVADEAKTPVSFGIVAVVVAATGFAPFLALRPVALSGVVALPLTTWLVRRFAVGRVLPLPRPSWRVSAALAVAGLLVFASYRVYHPLDSFGAGSGGKVSVFDVHNSGFADLTILHVEGGVLSNEGLWAPARLPYTVHARSGTDVFVRAPTCRSRTVTVTFSVLGRASTQQFAVSPSDCHA